MSYENSKSHARQPTSVATASILAVVLALAVSLLVGRDPAAVRIDRTSIARSANVQQSSIGAVVLRHASREPLPTERNSQ